MSNASPASLSPQLPAAIIAERAPGFRPRVGLILGSGLAGLADAVDPVEAIGYQELPGFPRPGVEGHVGRLVLGRLGGVDIACLQGRQHLYEGGSAAPIRVLVRTLKLIGCEILLPTNAAGSLIPGAGPGSLMMLTDHINLQPSNPLVGPNDDEFGPRFPAMEQAYDPALQAILAAAAGDVGVTLHRGVYAACLGPSFETPAEVRALGRLGADAVGMSTVPEVILARHCGLRVAAISVLTNEAAGLGGEQLSHAQTLEAAARAAGDMRRLLTRFLERLAAGEGAP
jgi:xanthosine phosphorylase